MSETHNPIGGTETAYMIEMRYKGAHPRLVAVRDTLDDAITVADKLYERIDEGVETFGDGYANVLIREITLPLYWADFDSISQKIWKRKDKYTWESEEVP